MAGDGARTVGRFGIGTSRNVVARLSALFALDAFGGGFVVQSLAAYWFHLRFGVDAATLGGIFFGANAFAGIVTRIQGANLQAHKLKMRLPDGLRRGNAASNRRGDRNLVSGWMGCNKRRSCWS